MSELRILEHAPLGLVEELAGTYASGGLRPIIDPDLELIRVDCVRCRAQEHDSLGIYRPVRIVPRARMTRGGRPAAPLLTILCDSCGYHDERPL